MTPPSQIAHYRIAGKLGEGGKGVVYRATDTRLNRFALDADRLVRLTGEARFLSNSAPNR